MNTLSNLSSLEWNHILLQIGVNALQMKLILYLSMVIVALTIVILIYVHRALHVILRASGLETVAEDVLTVDWIKYLFVSTISLGLISLYVYSKFV
ncbi:MAG: hypothetical protein JST46_11745 [Bacteroidetes bacterium]|nr:hypothetical protein [Bacteroidota bacterium]